MGSDGVDPKRRNTRDRRESCSKIACVGGAVHKKKRTPPPEVTWYCFCFRIQYWKTDAMVPPPPTQWGVSNFFGGAITTGAERSVANGCRPRFGHTKPCTNRLWERGRPPLPNQTPPPNPSSFSRITPLGYCSGKG